MLQAGSAVILAVKEREKALQTTLKSTEKTLKGIELVFSNYLYNWGAGFSLQSV